MVVLNSHFLQKKNAWLKKFLPWGCEYVKSARCILVTLFCANTQYVYCIVVLAGHEEHFFFSFMFAISLKTDFMHYLYEKS